MIRKKDQEVNDTKTAKATPSAELAPRGTVAPTLSGWYDPFGLLQEFDRNFDEMRQHMESMFMPALRFGSLSNLGSPAPLAARVDVKDTGAAYEVTAELPGFAKDEVEVNVTEDGLELQAWHKDDVRTGSKESGYIARERSYSSLRRIVSFPEAVNTEGVKAELKDGLLIVSAPKANPTPSPAKKKVQVQ